MTDHDFAGVALRYGTPLYVYELNEARARARELRAALPPAAALLYSLKANPLPPVVAALRAAGCQAEVSSAGELRTALDAGFPASGVLYTGPGKSMAEIEAALAAGVGLFSCESATELLRLRDAAAAARREVSVLLRLRPTGRPASRLSMGEGRQFGFGPRQAIEAWRMDHHRVAVRGYHVYLGSQTMAVQALLDGFAEAKRVIEQVCAATGSPPEIADVGGGFPWPYAEAGEGCELAPMAEGLRRLMTAWATAVAPEPWFESGRRLCASAGWLLTSVVDVKDLDGGTAVVVDAGINVLGGMTGLGRVLRPSVTFENLSAGASREPVVADVVGPLCTPLDRLAVRTVVQRPAVGDLLCVPNVGAYGLTASLTSFLSRPTPLEVVFDDGREAGVWQLANRHGLVAAAATQITSG